MDNTTITMPTELYNQLMKMADGLSKQSNRGTSDPYFYQIQETKMVPTTDGCGQETWWVNDSEQYHLKDYEEIKEYMVTIFQDEDDCNEREASEEYDRYEEDVGSIDEYLESRGFRQVEMTEDRTYKNCFFTEDAIRKHIKSNDYHYTNPVDYVSYAFRNPEMTAVVDLLRHLGE